MAQTGKRPISPHLGIYKPQLTSILSICHRLTGLFMIIGLPLLSWWLADLAFGDLHFACVIQLLKTPLGAVFVFSLTWSLYYHFFNGIRHLLWDIGWGFDLPHVYMTGWIVIGLSIIATLCTFIHILHQGIW